MMWILFVALQAVLLFSGIRRQRRAGRWSWSAFAFALGFAALECVILTVPIWLIDENRRYFWPVYGAAWVVAALNFVWFILFMRRCKMKARSASIEADQRDRP